MAITQLFNPPDVLEAHDEWRANCGPAALAAVLGSPLSGVRHLFPQFPKRAWVNPTAMKAALVAAGRRFRPATRTDSGFPVAGLAFVQIVGPWCEPGVPVPVAYRHTHWVGSREGWVYDINAGRWLVRHIWERDIIPAVVVNTREATGWRIRSGLELVGGWSS